MLRRALLVPTFDSPDGVVLVDQQPPIGQAGAREFEYEFGVTRRQVRKSEVVQEIERWETGKVRAKAEIEQIKQRVKNVVVQDEVSLIFDSHLRILDDPVLDQEIRTSIEQDRYSAEYAVSTHFRKLINNIKALDDTFFGQRISDFNTRANQPLDVIERLGHCVVDHGFPLGEWPACAGLWFSR